MDLLTLNAITQELQNTLVAAKVVGIHQPTDLLLVLVLRRQGKEHRLLISADPSYVCIYLTSRDLELRTLGSGLRLSFGRSLKHHIQGGEIEWISKPPLERVVHIDISKKELDGSKTSLRLIAEIMGRHSNVILMDITTGKILDSIKHVTASMTSYRRIVPGAVYIPPPEQEKLNPLDLTKEDFIKILASRQPEKPFWQYILDTFKGFSPLMAREVQEDPNPDIVWCSFERIRKALQCGPYEPVIVTLPDEPGTKSRSYLSPIQLVQFASDQVHVQVFDSISQAADAYYSENLSKHQLEAQRSSLLQAIAKRLTRAEKKQKQLKEELARAEKAEEVKRLGELVKANLSRLERGISEAEVIDFYDPDQKKVKIKLDPRLTPSQNAQKYFSQYTKLKRGIPIVRERMVSVSKEAAYLKELQFFVEEAISLEELENLQSEIRRWGERFWESENRRNGESEKFASPIPRFPVSPILRQPIPRFPDSPVPPLSHSPFRRFLSSDGYSIWVGRSGQENDLLTFKFAKPEDLWLHAQGVPGSHVLILNRTRSESVPERTLEEAARLAAYYSKGRRLGKVPVDYTLKKYVRKPKGSPPGLVTLMKHKTILVTPPKEVTSGK